MAASSSEPSPCREVDGLAGDRSFPGELRLPDVATIVRVTSRAELEDRGRFETRDYISSAVLTAARAAEAVRSHWAIENSLHWVIDVTFADDQSRLRTGHGAKNMAIVRHFAINLIRTINDKRSIKPLCLPSPPIAAKVRNVRLGPWGDDLPRGKFIAPRRGQAVPRLPDGKIR